MFKTYINGTSLSYIQYLSNIWLPSVSPIIPDGKTKAPAEEKSNFMISTQYRSVEVHSGCIQVSQFIIKHA